MDFKQYGLSLFQGTKQLLLHPREFWNGPSPQVYRDRVVSRMYAPLVLLAGLAIFAGEVIHSFEILWSYALLKGMREIVSYFMQFFLAVPVLAALLKNYGGRAGRNTLRMVVVSTLIPFVLASTVTGLFPGLYIISITGLYGFYLFATGSLYQLEIPKENQSRFITLAILLNILIFGITNLICWRIFDALFPYGA
ncbi:MAG: YIP1 family protein [Mangrovibacterium sp.]